MVNRKFHALPYLRIRGLLHYKLAMYGITLITQNEAYSSRCSPIAPLVSRKFARKSNRVQRGLYKDGGFVWNADVVGAYNILRLFLQSKNGDPAHIRTLQTVYPKVLKVAA